MLRMVRRLDVFTVPYKGLEKSSPVFLESPMNADCNARLYGGQLRKPSRNRRRTHRNTLANLVVAGNNLIKKQPHKLSCC